MLRVGRGAKNSTPWKVSCYETSYKKGYVSQSRFFKNCRATKEEEGGLFYGFNDFKAKWNKGRGYGLDDRGLIHCWLNDGTFSIRHRLKTGSGAHPAPYPMGTEALISGSNADHSPPFSAEVRNAWSYTSTPKYS